VQVGYYKEGNKLITQHPHLSNSVPPVKETEQSFKMSIQTYSLYVVIIQNTSILEIKTMVVNTSGRDCGWVYSINIDFGMAVYENVN
jgi:hypothetical protein